MVIRAPYGGGVHGALYHSQSIEAFYGHVPGLKVVVPSTPHDVEGHAPRRAIRDPDPVLFLEHKKTYRLIKGEVPDGPYEVPIGMADVKREGDGPHGASAYGLMLHTCLEAAARLAGGRGSRSRSSTSARSPRSTRRRSSPRSARPAKAIVVYEDNRTYGAGAEISATIAEEAMFDLDAPVVRIGGTRHPGHAVRHAPRALLHGARARSDLPPHARPRPPLTTRRIALLIGSAAARSEPTARLGSGGFGTRRYSAGVDEHPTPTPRRGRSSVPRDLVVAGAVLAGASACALTGASFGLLWGAIAAIGLTAAVLGTLAATQRGGPATAEDDEGRFRAMVEQVPAIAYTWDTTRPTGEAPPVYISPQLEAILGYTPQEWSDHPELWLEAMHPDDRERVRRSSDDADRAGSTFHEEYRIFAKDGRMLWLRDDSLVVARDENGNAIRAQGVMFDITRQKQAEARLQEAENRYRTIVERVPAVAYVWDAGNEPGTAPAAYISPQIQRLLGYTPEEWFDDPNLWADRLHPEDVDVVFSRWDAAVADAGAFTAEYRIRSKAGELLWLRDEAIPVADGASGRPVYQGVMYDITEQRGTNERLREAEERYRTLVENLPVVTLHRCGRRDRRARPAALRRTRGNQRLTGYTPEAWTADAGFWESLIQPKIGTASSHRPWRARTPATRSTRSTG